MRVRDVFRSFQGSLAHLNTTCQVDVPCQHYDSVRNLRSVLQEAYT